MPWNAGSSEISATILLPENNYAQNAAYALVHGVLHIFGGNSDANKVLFCSTNLNYEIGKKESKIELWN
jgi:hypothetical protein